MREFKADLHIHTCLSPCAENEMTPRGIINEAKKSLDIIGICDHNSSANVHSIRKMGKMENLKVLGGIEITTREEVHILALFERDESLAAFQKVIDESLSGKNDDKVFGEQLILNERDELVGKNDRLLIGATELPIERAVGLARSLAGLIIASHVDREGFSIISRLGFVPNGLEIDALEVSNPAISTTERYSEIGKAGMPLVSFSDAHCLKNIGKSSTTFFIEEPTVLEIKKAIKNIDGRYIIAYSGCSSERN